MAKKQFLKALVTKVNEDEFSLDVAIASTPAVDRQGESIAPTAWRLENFKKNPVFLWAHNYTQPPLGKVTNLHVKGDKLMFRPVFAAHLDEFSNKIFRMFKEGYLNAFSVGFNPAERPELEKNGEGDGDGVPTYKNVDLLEISAVPVPANPEALVVARSYGFDDKFIKSMEDAYEKSQHDICDPNDPSYDPAACANRQAKEHIDAEIIGNRINIQIRDPQLYIQDSLTTIEIDVERGIWAIVGKLLGDPDGANVITVYLFDVAKWTVDEALLWVSDNAPDTTPTRSVKTIITVDQEHKLLGAHSALKLAADAITDVLKDTKVRDNDGATQKARSETPSNVLRIVRTESKRATRSVERINRVLKIVAPSKTVIKIKS